MRDSFRRHGLAEPDDNAVKRIVGLPLLDAIARLAPHVGDDDHIRLKEGYSEAFFALRRAKTVHEPLYPGVAAGIDAIAADGWLLGVATGKSLRGLENTLSGHGLLDRFQTLQTSDKAAGKPNPDMLLRAWTRPAP